MGMEDAACDVGSENGCWIIVLAWLTGPFQILLGGLIEGKTKNDMAPLLKWFVICELLCGLFGIGYLMSCCIACKTKTKSGG